jgi:hypothetical protein
MAGKRKLSKTARASTRGKRTREFRHVSRGGVEVERVLWVTSTGKKELRWASRDSLLLDVPVFFRNSEVFVEKLPEG